MTTANLNPHPAPEQSRLILRRLLSNHAREKGLATLGGAFQDRDKTGRVSKTTRPQPDLIWLKGKRHLWKFYILPNAPALRRLRKGIDFASGAIVCEDSSKNLGIIDPLQFLLFLGRTSTSIDNDALYALEKDVAPLQAPPPDFHFKGVVRKNRQFIRDHFSLCIGTGFVQKPTPGQFLQLLCDPVPHAESSQYRCHSYSDRRPLKFRGSELLGKRPFLRRPFSIASYEPPSPKHNLEEFQLLGADWFRLVHWLEAEFEIIYRRIAGGAGTEALAEYEVGDEVDVVGPLGRGFTIEPLPEVAILVGGGIGAPPLLFLAEQLVKSGVHVEVFLGAVTKARIPFPLKRGDDRIAHFERLGLHPVICTDDGSAGFRGLVTDALLTYIEKEGVNTASTKMFACGPRSMLAALDGITDRFGLPCEVLLEERMACGFGACISCVCAVKEPGQKAQFTRICTEGPAFDARKVMWHA